MNGKAFFAGWDVLFADGNAAARTFGRAHRRRPYHFSCGSCHKIAGEMLADGQKREKVAGEVLAADIPHCLSQENSSPHHKHK